jgi:glucose/arabinose dehydrogenase
MARKLLRNLMATILIVMIIAAAFLSSQTLVSSGQPQTQETVEAAYPNLNFNQPVGILSPKDQTNRLFVIEQPGIIRVFENDANTETSTVFLDIASSVTYGGEQGLLGLAFDPDYQNNGYLYINYITDNPRRTVIARYNTSTANPNEADMESQLILLEILQPFTNHNGGNLAFGPDGYLYIGTGDGGSGGDPYGNGQNRSSLLGKILRIDVTSTSQDRNYSIPDDNPFAGNSLGYKEEIFAIGFRNPWRFSFDGDSQRLWVADVGQQEREEVDLVEKGKNYGWNIMEGSLPYAGGNQEGLELPIWEYGHGEGTAVIGGYVYQGPTATTHAGSYIYGDYGSGRIWALTLSETDEATNTLVTDTSLNILSFGLDEKNELYICASDGKIYRLSASVIPEFPTLLVFAFVILAILVLTIAIRKRDSQERKQKTGRGI